MRRGQDATHQARRDRVDVSVCLDVTAGNVTNPFDDRLDASLMALTLDGAGHSAGAYRLLPGQGRLDGRFGRRPRIGRGRWRERVGVRPAAGAVGCAVSSRYCQSPTRAHADGSTWR